MCTHRRPLTAVEAVIEKALYQAGRISAPNYGDLKKVRWTRSSRTDKGVHSVCTVPEHARAIARVSSRLQRWEATSPGKADHAVRREGS